MQTRKTKIVCSLGPSSSTDEAVRKLILAGMNVARLNFSHGTHETHGASIERVRRISAELGKTVAIALDVRGPGIRTGMVENDGTVTINRDDNVAITTDDCLTTAVQGQTPARISISWKGAASKLKAGHHVLISDGLLNLEVLGVENGVVNCRACNTYTIGSKKNVNLIGVHAGLPIIGEKDKDDIAFGVKMGVDYICSSFLSFPEEVIEIRKYLETLDSTIKIIGKIESSQGLDNIEKIAQVIDGIMVARGDLAEQIPIEDIPLAQKHIITTCRKAGKPVITATQMLDSMIVNPRPTRAELTDVANAIFDGTDAIMLSGETANGAYPVEAVQMMDKIALNVEQSEEYRTRVKSFRDECFSGDPALRENLGVMMTRSGVETASAVGAKAIIVPTLSGNTARMLSVYRPEEPIIALSPNSGAIREMQLFFGVQAFHSPLVDDTESMIQNTIKIASDTGIAGKSDKIVLVAGLPLHSPYSVNTVRVLILGTILARSSAGGNSNPDITYIYGKIVHADTASDARDKIMKSGGEILVSKTLTEEFTPILRIVKGVVCEGVSELSDNELREINPNLVWLTHIRYATEELESGKTVTIDAKQLLVYEGTI